MVGNGLRKVGWDTVWLDALQLEHADQAQLIDFLIFDDVRYLNELDFVRRNSGILIWIHNQELLNEWSKIPAENLPESEANWRELKARSDCWILNSKDDRHNAPMQLQGILDMFIFG
jgi:hypothetical protein